MKSEKLERYLMADANANSEVDAELSRLGPQYVEEIITHLLKIFRNLPEGIGPGTGMSIFQRIVSSNASDKAWRIISGMGWSGIQTLLSAIDSENHTRGVVACIILSEEMSPNEQIAEEIYKLKRVAEFDSSRQVDKATQLIGNLTARTLSLGGAPAARKWVENLCSQKAVSYDDWLRGIVENAVCFVRDS